MWRRGVVEIGWCRFPRDEGDAHSDPTFMGAGQLLRRSSLSRSSSKHASEAGMANMTVLRPAVLHPGAAECISRYHVLELWRLDIYLHDRT